MKPVYQVPGDGKCFAACIATLLGVGLEDVPPPPPTDDEDPTPFWNALVNWLKERGWAIVRLSSERCLWSGAPVIVGGGSPRGTPAGHAVIMRNAGLLHDPHPDGQGVTSRDEFWLLVPREPWRLP